MGKGKESSGKSAAELKKPPPPPKPSSSTASDKSSTPRTTTMTEAPSKKVHDERQENMEKAYNKILKGGWSLIGLAFDEYDKIQKEVAGPRQETHANTISLFSEVAAIRSSGSLEGKAVQQLQEIQKQQAQSHEQGWKKLLEWQTALEQKIEALLKLKTPCALTKVELTTTMRKEFDTLRQYQAHLFEVQPKPVVEDDLQTVLEDQQELRKTLQRIEDKADRNANDIGQITATLENISRDIRRLCTHEVTRPPSVRRSPQADDHRSSHRDRSRSRRPEEPTVRSIVRRVPTPNRDDTRTLQQIRNDIRDTDDKLRRLKRQMEHTLRENEPDSTDRLHDMNEDKKKLIAQKERLESMERRLAHDTRHQESRHGRSPPGKRSRTDSSGHQ